MKKKAVKKKKKKKAGKKKTQKKKKAAAGGKRRGDAKKNRVKKSKKKKTRAAPVKKIKKEAKEESAAVEEGLLELERALKEPRRGYKNSLLLYFDEIRGEKVLTEEEEKDLIKRAQSGEKTAREKLIRANLKLVVKIAKKYEYFGVPLVDLVEEGNIGLMRAVEKILPEKGFRFSTYATWWIKQSVNRAIANQKNTIRIPVHILDIYHRYLKLIEKEVKEKGNYPGREELARKLKIAPLKLNEILNIIKAPKSLDLEYESDAGDSTRTLKDTIENVSEVKPDDEFFEKEKREKLLKLIRNLSRKEQEVIISRFGLDNNNVMTLEEIGEKLKLTRERIRQIEMIAIKKLKYLMRNRDNL